LVIPPMPPRASQPASNAVCIISDDSAVRRSLAMLLRLEGLTVVCADVMGAVQAARSAASLARHRCCVLIDDAGPHGPQGLALAEFLAGSAPNLPVVLLANPPAATFWRRAAAARVVAVVEKPVTADAIVLGVARALSAGTAGDLAC
jgi:DNA-binding NtrC family response regulator